MRSEMEHLKSSNQTLHHRVRLAEATKPFPPIGSTMPGTPMEAMHQEIEALKAAADIRKEGEKELEDELQGQQDRGEGVNIDLDRMLKEHRETSGTRGPVRRSSLTETLLKEHHKRMQRIDTEIKPTYAVSKAIHYIVQAQIALSRGQYIEAHDSLNRAETENNASLPREKRNIEGRIQYWKGRALLGEQNAESAVQAFQLALDIEQRSSIHGTLYAPTTTEADEADVDWKQRGVSLEVRKWLQTAMEATGGYSPRYAGM